MNIDKKKKTLIKFLELHSSSCYNGMFHLKDADFFNSVTFKEILDTFGEENIIFRKDIKVLSVKNKNIDFFHTQCKKIGFFSEDINNILDIESYLTQSAKTREDIVDTIFDQALSRWNKISNKKLQTLSRKVFSKSTENSFVSVKFSANSVKDFFSKKVLFKSIRLAKKRTIKGICYTTKLSHTKDGDSIFLLSFFSHLVERISQRLYNGLASEEYVLDQFLREISLTKSKIYTYSVKEDFPNSFAPISVFVGNGLLLGIILYVEINGSPYEWMVFDTFVSNDMLTSAQVLNRDSGKEIDLDFVMVNDVKTGGHFGYHNYYG